MGLVVPAGFGAGSYVVTGVGDAELAGGFAAGTGVDVANMAMGALGGDVAAGARLELGVAAAAEAADVGGGDVVERATGAAAVGVSEWLASGAAVGLGSAVDVREPVRSITVSRWETF